jgi:hypothetical protein
VGGSVGNRHSRRNPAKTLALLSANRRKLLELHYQDKISADGFVEEERRIADRSKPFAHRSPKRALVTLCGMTWRSDSCR